MTVLLLIGVSGAPKYVFALSGDAMNNARIAGYANTAEFGFRIEYVIESVLFLFILLMNYKKIGEDERSLTMVNVYLMFCGVLLFFCKSSDGGRISWYCLLGVIVILEKLCRPKSAVPLKRFHKHFCVFVLFYRILSVMGDITPIHTRHSLLQESDKGTLLKSCMNMIMHTIMINYIIYDNCIYTYL